MQPLLLFLDSIADVVTLNEPATRTVSYRQPPPSAQFYSRLNHSLFMNSRFKNLVSSRRKSSTSIGNGNTSSVNTTNSTSGQSSPLAQSNASSTSIPPPMNSHNPERPPSYPYSPRGGPGGLGPPQQAQNRPSSPLPPPIQTAGQVPPPSGGYPPQGHQQMYGQPPPYPPGNGPPPPPSQRGGYGYGPPYGRGAPGGVAEVEGATPSKAQLIVGIDFVCGQ